MPRFHGQVGLVTGAASGIGEAVAKGFAQEGGIAVIADVNFTKARRIAEEIVLDGGVASALQLDVADAGSWEAAVAETLRAHGHLDVLVNNAGISDGRTIDTTTPERYRHVISVTQDGVFLGHHIAGPALKASGRGAVVNVGSMFALVGGFGTGPAYHAAKGAVQALSRNVALAWATDGVRVNTVHPGFIETPILGRLDRETLADLTPLGRLGTPGEVAAVILFLASADASFVTGAEITIDGGYTAR